jgi:uncharacterized protein involved in exopolysaccharide biosynthesis
VAAAVRTPAARPVALVAAVVLAALGLAAGYVQSRPDVYTSTAVVSLSPKDAAKIGADNLELAASRYTAYLSAPATLATVAGRIGERPADVAAGTRVEVQPNTVNIQIRATSRDPERAAQVSNTLAAEGIRVSATDGLVSAALVVPAVVASGPSGPRRALIVLGGTGVGAGVAVLLLAALGYFRDAEVLGGGEPVRLAPRGGAG